MPISAPRPCTHPGCSALVSKGSRCPAHPYEVHRSLAAKEYNRLYNTARWRKRRVIYLRNHPLCCDCEARQVIKSAQVVDHIQPHKGDTALFFDESNWQPLCKRCHDRKTAAENGGFGNVK